MGSSCPLGWLSLGDTFLRFTSTLGAQLYPQGLHRTICFLFPREVFKCLGTALLSSWVFLRQTKRPQLLCCFHLSHQGYSIEVLLKEHSPQGEIEMSSHVGADLTPCCISARINTCMFLQWCRNNWRESNSYTHLLKSCQQESVQVWTENRRSAPDSVVPFFPLNIAECKVRSLRANNSIENCPLRTLKQDLRDQNVDPPGYRPSQ